MLEQSKLNSAVQRFLNRFRTISIRRMMLGVAIVGLLAFGFVTKLRWMEFRRLAAMHEQERQSAFDQAEFWKKANESGARQMRILMEMDVEGTLYLPGMITFARDLTREERERYKKLATDPASQVEEFRRNTIEHLSSEAAEHERRRQIYSSRWW
jgi:hypothetical protein